MCLIVSTLLLWLVPLLFARFESCSFEGDIQLDFNEFLSVRYNVSIVLQRYTFFLKNVQNVLFFENVSYISSMDKPPLVTSLPRNMRRFISVTFSSRRAGEYF